MRFSIASVLAFASAVLAQAGDEPTPGFNVITAPAKWEKVPAGKSYPIVWSPDAGHPGAITIKLYGGAAQNSLEVVETVATGVDGADGTFPWAVASTLGNKAVYGFKIILESNTTVWQWGNPFEITSGKDTSSSASASASASVSASVSASASASRSASVSASVTASSTKVSTTVTSTIISESSNATSTFTRISSSSIHGNSTITHATVTTFTTGTASRGTATSTSTSSIKTNGAAAMGANGLALFGGVAMAVLAL